ncbi:MAG: ABC transporter ATP-binding protein [Planctomycetota bacterium]
MIDVQALTKVFYTHQGQEHVAVDGLSFHVARGEIYGLLGPNGAGKTTTLRMLAGLMQPTCGEVTIDGVNGSSDPLALKQRTGFLTANTGLYARLSPRETLAYFGQLRGLAPGELQVQVEQLIDLLGMQLFAGRRCEGLSTGEKQRVQIARTLVGNPPVLILDEPTLGLDVLTNRLILNFIREAGQAGRTIVLSTHHLDEVEHICQRFGLLHKGKLLAEGTLDALRALSGMERLSDVFLALVERVEGRSAVDSISLGTAVVEQPSGLLPSGSPGNPEDCPTKNAAGEKEHGGRGDVA